MSLATLKSRFKAATNTLLDERQAHEDAWASASSAGDWDTASVEMLATERAFTKYANAIKALPWPTSMRSDAKAVQTAAVKCALDAHLLSAATSEYDAAYTIYAPASLADWEDLAAKIIVLNDDL